MKNIRAKQESPSNWREEMTEGKQKGLDGKACWDGYSLKGTKKKGGKTVDNCVKVDEAKVDDKHSPEGKEKERNKRKYGNWPVSQGAQTSVRRGVHWSNRGDKKRRGAKVEEGIEGGISVETLTKDTKFLEVETIDIIKPEPIKGASNWRLEMVTESLISEGYNDEEIVTILLSEELPKVPLGGMVTGALRAAWNLSSKGVKGAYDLGKGARSLINRASKDTKLTGDIISTAKKLRNPDGISVTKNSLNKGGGIAKSFKGFMQRVKKSGSNLIDRTKGKLDRTDIKTSTPTTSTKPVEVLGGAATNPSAAVKPMKNITPVGDGVANVANKIKIGAGTAAGAGGVVAGSKLTSGSTATTDALPNPVKLPSAQDKKLTNPETSKEIDPVPLPGVKSKSKEKDEAPITNDGKKQVDPSKNEKINTPLTKRELRNKRNEYMSSKEGRRERRDATLQSKKDSGFPSRRKLGTPVNQLFNKEEVAIDENRMASHTAGMSDAQKDAATSSVSRSTADKMGRRSDESAFKGRKKKTSARYSSTSGKKRKNTTGRGQPEQYRKSADSPENEGRYPYGRSKIVQGKGSFKGLKKEEFENIQELDNMGGPAAIGAVVAAGAGLAKSAFDGINNLKNTLQDKQNEKKKKIKNLTQSYSWRDELGLIEGRTTTIKGIKVRGSGHPKDSAAGTNENPKLDYSKIRAKAPVKTDTKVG